jgi:hypothetical protein
MTDKDLDELESSVDKLKEMLSGREIGCATWWIALGKLWQDIKEWGTK